ncbi:MAG: hypothetical protein MUF40_00075 [Gemmatimonadaceae bacterium]|jgi:hypothetical protein|nr:hypothetical protein [Gemmatimonadaceae bacterium]
MHAPYAFDSDPFADPFEDAFASVHAAGGGAAVAAYAPAGGGSPVTTGSGVALAEALAAAGYRAAATALARADGSPAALALVDEWARIADADASLAARIAQSHEALVPSVQTTAAGAPRFVLSGDAVSLAAVCREEHGPTGMQPELRTFLDEALRAGDVFVDAAPGAGLAVLGAATGVTAAAVVAATDDAATAAQLRASARASDCAARVHTTALDQWEGATRAQLAGDGLVVLHAGDAADVAPLIAMSRTLVRGDRLGAVAWRCGTSADEAEGMQVAAAVLGVLGFTHFALAWRDGEAELVPADAMASNEYIFSVSPAFIGRSGG